MVLPMSLCLFVASMCLVLRRQRKCDGGPDSSCLIAVMSHCCIVNCISQQQCITVYIMARCIVQWRAGSIADSKVQCSKVQLPISAVFPPPPLRQSINLCCGGKSSSGIKTAVRPILNKGQSDNPGNFNTA